MYQVIIRNGTVIDPANNLHVQADVAIEDGRIAQVGSCSGDAVMTVDAEGCIVTPGLIDHHSHLFPIAKIGIPAEAMCFSSGVTTAVDAGSSGCDTFEKYLPFIENSKLTIKAYVNVCSTGLDSLPRETENVNPASYDRNGLAKLFDRYGEYLLGLKLRTSKEIVKDLGYEPLRGTVALAEDLGQNVMIHSTNPPGEMNELLGCLRRGDVLTHMYMNKGSTIMDESGKVSTAAYDARKRGVIFEAADARGHFSFEVSEPAIAQGFLPDIIATDLTRLSMNLRPTAFSMANQLSKYYMLGLDIDRLIECCTSAPAHFMGLDGKAGCLTPGTWGDVAVFKMFECSAIFGDRTYADPSCILRKGTKRLRPMLTIKRGEAVYRDAFF